MAHAYYKSIIFIMIGFNASLTHQTNIIKIHLVVIYVTVVPRALKDSVKLVSRIGSLGLVTNEPGSYFFYFRWTEIC